MKINGEMHYLWRAVDQEGEILESFVTKRRDKEAALSFMRKALKRHGSPEAITTDGLASYKATMKVLGNIDKQEIGRWANNRVENSHLPFRRRERAMLRFRQMKRLQKFASVHPGLHNHFNQEPHLVDRQTYKLRRSAALEWQPSHELSTQTRRPTCEVRRQVAIRLMRWMAHVSDGCCRSNSSKGPSTMEITTIGLDLAKSVFQLPAVDADGAVVWRKKVRRGALLETLAQVPACVVGMEVCATAHHWAREMSALGHEVRLMPPVYVRAYLRRQKNDAADAEAICEAVRRPTMRFVVAKSAERQAVLVLHRSRELLVRQRTMLISAIRGHCAEFGLIAAQGVCGSRDLATPIRQPDSAVLPDMAKDAMVLLVEQLHSLVRQIQSLNRRLLIWHRQDQVSQRLATIPGVGGIRATALAASVTDPSQFRSGREFSASLVLVPRQNSSGGKDKLGRISKMGDRYLRKLLVVGATSVVRRARTDDTSAAYWVRSLLERKPARLVTVAMANKTARILWAVLARCETYRSPAAI